MQLGDMDGYGRFGILEETEDGLVCHECGQAFGHLGLHVWRAHGMRADQYRAAHGLQRGRGLVAAQLRARIQTNAANRMDTPAGRAFAAGRDPRVAQEARLGRQLTWREATRATNRAARAGVGRLGTEVVCRGCGAVFCPLHSARRRLFCSRGCASSYNRRNR